MFKEKVNARTDGRTHVRTDRRTHARTTDNRPWHKLAGLQPVELKIAETDFVYTLASPNINRSAPNVVKMYVTIRSRMSSIMDLIRADLSELFALEFAKIAESDFVCTLASTNVDQCVPNMVKIYMTMRSWMSSIMGKIWQ